MEYRTLGNTGLRVSVIGLGTWGLSGEGYGPVEPDVAEEVISNAIDLGINFIDTADSYGNGKAEEIIGKVISNRNDSDTIIATKFGWDFYNRNGIRSNLDRKYIRFALEQSLKRLNRDWIDIYQIHVPRPDRIHNHNVYGTLEELKEEGLIKHYGISIKYKADGIDAIKRGHVSTIQLPFNMMHFDAESNLIPEASSLGVGIIAREALASGLLSGKYSVDSRFHKKDHRNGWKKEFLVKELGIVEELKKLVHDNRSLVQMAVAFVRQNKNVSTIVTGCKNKEQLNEILDSQHIKIDESEMQYIHDLNNFYINVSRL